MTWLKVSDDYPDQCADLSDAAYRTHTEGLCWCMRRETGGYLSRRDVRRMAESNQAEEAVQELLELGFWEVEGNGYRIKHHMEHQPEPEVIRKRREAAAERQRKNRLKKAGVAVMSQRDKTRDDGRDKTRDPGRVGTGRDGRAEEGNTTGGAK